MPSADDGGERWLLRDVEINGDRCDCRIADGRIVAIAAALAAQPGEQIVQAGGGALLPGLTDHHLHMFATAAAAGSLDLAGGRLADVSTGPGTGWLRVVGAGEESDRTALDRIWPDRPVRVQHRSGAVWTLNSAAVELVRDGLSTQEQRTGQIWRDDARLRRLLGSEIDEAALRKLGARLAACGLTHLTDATPDLDAAALARLRDTLPQHVRAMSDADPAMPRKLVIADHELPDLDTVAARIAAAHAAGRPVAVHAVSAATLAITLAALGAAGAIRGDRVEHAAVCDDDAAAGLAELGVVVVTQPGLAIRHGAAYLRDSEERERPLLWRHAGLLRAGVAVVVSSDAPYGEPDPWAILQAAATRRLADGTVLGPDEAVPADVVLASMLTPPDDPAGAPRTIAVGAPADLCLLTRPLGAALHHAVDAATAAVAATFVAGRIVHSTPSVTEGT